MLEVALAETRPERFRGFAFADVVHEGAGQVEDQGVGAVGEGAQAVVGELSFDHEGRLELRRDQGEGAGLHGALVAQEDHFAGLRLPDPPGAPGRLAQGEDVVGRHGKNERRERVEVEPSLDEFWVGDEHVDAVLDPLLDPCLALGWGDRAPEDVGAEAGAG